MSIATFGVVAADIRAHFFPSLAAWSTTTKPTLATVTEMISAEAAVLSGKLGSEGLVPSVVAADTAGAAYAWCQDVIRTGAAIRVMTAIAGAGAVPTAWQGRIDDRYKELEREGGIVLGDATLPTLDPNGPRSHIITHGLDTGDTADISDAVPRFRRSDAL